MRNTQRITLTCPRCGSNHIKSVKRIEVTKYGVMMAWLENEECKDCGKGWKVDRLTGLAVQS